MFQEKLRLQGTQMTFPTHMYNVLHSVLVKKMAVAAMLRHVRKTLRCNQSLLGGRGFRGINRLCQPIGLRLGKPSITNICCPLCQKKSSESWLWGPAAQTQKLSALELGIWIPELLLLLSFCPAVLVATRQPHYIHYASKNIPRYIQASSSKEDA